MLASHDVYKYAKSYFNNDDDNDGGGVPFKLTDVQSFKDLLTSLEEN